MKLWNDLISPLLPILGSVIAGPVGGAAGGALSGIGKKGNTAKNMFSGGLSGLFGGFGNGLGNLMSMFGGGGNQFAKSASWGIPQKFNPVQSGLKGYFGSSGSGSPLSLMDNFNMPTMKNSGSLGNFNSLFGGNNNYSGWDSNQMLNKYLKIGG